MYKKNIYKVRSNVALSAKTWLMVLEGGTQYLTAPGQFVNVAIEGKFLRRPISVCDYDEQTITLLYDVVGEGTKYMSGLAEGAELDLLTGLGNGFDTEVECQRPLLLGGGVGIAPMLNLAKVLASQGKRPVVIAGCNTAADAVVAELFEQSGAEVYVATVDGSVGTKGFVTDVIREKALDFDYLYTCGPLPMLKALYDATESPAEFSFEERMGCGFGACMGCSCKTKYGNKRICKDGPVLKREEIIW
jgi:dihydroorotate dehydrogenase electron transfer subunit